MSPRLRRRAPTSVASAVEEELPRLALPAVAACAALGYAATLFALSRGARSDAFPVLATATLLLAPFPIGPGLLRGRTASRLRGWTAVLVASLQVALAMRVWGARDGSLLAALLCGAQGHALTRVPQSGASALTVAIALGQTAAALRVVPADAGLVVLFVQIALAALALVLLHARRARRLVRRASRVGSAAPTDGVDVRGRVTFALRLGAALVLPALVLMALGTRAGDAATWLRERGAGAGAGVDEPEQAAPDGAEREDAGAPTVWRGGIGSGEGVGRLSDEVVAWVRPRLEAGRAPPRALWLVVLPLDTFAAGELGNPDLGRMGAHADADDGRADGWIRLAQASPGEALLLEVLQRPLRVSSAAGDALLRSQPLLALEAERALFSPDAALVLPGARDDWFAYRLLCAAPWSLPEPRTATRARHADPRFTQLPPASEDLARIERVARQIGAGAASDRERVQRVLEFLADGFTYTLEGGGFSGVAGVVDFLEAREGYCTAFAATAVLLLRSQGLASRAAGGYLAHERDEAGSGFVVRGRNAHAWVEVHFEGLGWRTFDPTPSSEREQAFARALDPAAPGVGSWGADMFAALRDAALNQGGGSGLARVGASLAAAPEALSNSVARRPWSWGAGLLAAFLLAASLVRRGVRGTLRAAGLRLDRAPASIPFYERLLSALAGLGLRPRSAETPREFALRAVAQGPAGLEGVPRATEIYYAARFGARDPDPDEQAFLDGVLHRVRRTVREPSAPREAIPPQA